MQETMVPLIMNMDSPTSSKEKLLRTTIDLLCRKGYESTSVQDILDAAQVTKSNFYYHFKSKEVLCLSAMDFLKEQYVDTMLKKTLLNRVLSPRERFQALFDIFIEKQNSCEQSYGCPFVNLATETSSFYPSFREKMDHFFMQYQEHLTQCYREGMEQGQFRSDIDAVQTGRFLLACLNGSMVLTKVHPQADILRSNAAVFFQLVDKSSEAH